MTIGEKRNKLMAMATGQYIAFIDDDDRISPYYLATIINAIRNGYPDVIGIVGIYKSVVNGKPIHERFYHTIKNNRYWKSQRGWERPPNHLNPMKREIAIRYDFMPSNFGEDTDWAMRICDDQALKSENFIVDPIYFYDYVKDKTY
jgi:glycosyltransferase involved in cell wall biosynthesis